MTRVRRPLVAPLVAIAVVATVAACSPTDRLGTVPPPTPLPSPSVDQGELDLTPAPSGPVPSKSPEILPRASSGATTIVRTYFYLDGERGSAGLVPLLREVPQTGAIAGAAMSALLAGPTAGESALRVVTSAVPVGSRLLGLSIENGIATVDLSSEFESGGGSASVFIRLGQVVYTLTQFPTIQSVAFEVEGRPATVFSSEGIVLDSPVGRADYTDLLSAIFVDQPAYGAGLGNPARVTGTANVFEAAFLITLLDGSGGTLVEVPVMATCGTGCRGTFDVMLPYSVPEPGWGTLRVWDASARDGSPENVREYPVWLTPTEAGPE